MALNTVNTILAIIQTRHGIEADFDADKMTIGEWSLSTDKKIVRICIMPGLCIRMATYEAFEEDMKEVQIILATCQNIQAAVEKLADLAEQHKNNAAASAEAAEGFSDLSKSYAIGTDGEVRENDDIDNSKYYYEQSKRLTQGFNGIVPMGTISFADLDNPENQVAKYMFNISDAFTSDSRFKDGGGKYYDVGTNVVRTADNMWDALASSSDQSVVFSESSTRTNINSGEKLSVMFGKIKKWFADLKPVAFSNSYTDLDNKPSIPTLTNNLLATEPGTALDAVQGKALDDKITQINSDLSSFKYIYYDNEPTKTVKSIADDAPARSVSVYTGWSALQDYPNTYGGTWLLEIVKGESPYVPRIMLTSGINLFIGKYHIGMDTEVSWKKVLFLDELN